MESDADLTKPFSGGFVEATLSSFGNGRVKLLLRIAISFS
jgi:hypothetical protein